MSNVHSDRGSSTIEFTWLTILLLVPFVYLMIAVFEVQRAAYGVSAASNAGARAFMQAPNSAVAESAAKAAAEITMADYGLSSGSVTITCESGCFDPGGQVRVVVAATQPLPLVPDFLGTSFAAVGVDSTHTEPFGRYRASR